MKSKDLHVVYDNNVIINKELSPHDLIKRNIVPIIIFSTSKSDHASSFQKSCKQFINNLYDIEIFKQEVHLIDSLNTDCVNIEAILYISDKKFKLSIIKNKHFLMLLSMILFIIFSIYVKFFILMSGLIILTLIYLYEFKNSIFNYHIKI